jgi:hypothetical protein
MKIFIPVSLGELYDKITILEIKQKEIKDENKLVFINKELELLNDIASEYPIESDLYLRLKRVNLHLWKIEDDIRMREKEQRFDDYFIHFARSVYKTNDERSEIKREINEQYDSDIVEVKSYEKY